MAFILTIILGGAALITYSIIEKRINQRPCPVCGFRMSADALDQPCPRCDAASRRAADN